MSVNKVFILGNVGTQPIVKTVSGPSGDRKVATFSVATSEHYKDRSGEWHETTEWHSAQCWEKTAEVVERFVQKGTQVFVEGSLRSRKYTDKEGVERTVTEIKVENIQLLGGRRQEQQEAAPQSFPQRPRQQSRGQQAPAYNNNDFDPDLGF